MYLIQFFSLCRKDLGKVQKTGMRLFREMKTSFIRKGKDADDLQISKKVFII